jgi:hypothetical protein
MDDIIYLIVLIAWVAFAFYRKTQKKGAAVREAERKARPSGNPSPFPTLEEILLGKEPVPEAEPVPASGPFTTDGMAPVLTETSFEKEYKLAGISSIEEMDKPFFSQKSEVIDIQEDDDKPEYNVIDRLKTDFDLRQAFIYSEILNRPYV